MMKKLILLLTVLITMCACTNTNNLATKISQYEYNIEETSNSVRIIELGSELGKGSLSLKKAYVKDHFGYTHEILISSTRTTDGGEYMLELCKYRE